MTDDTAPSGPYADLIVVALSQVGRPATETELAAWLGVGTWDISRLLRRLHDQGKVQLAWGGTPTTEAGWELPNRGGDATPGV